MTSPIDQSSEPVWAPELDTVAADPPEAAPLETSVAAAAAAADRSRLKTRPRKSNSVTALLAVSALVAVGGIGFAVGRLGSTAQTTTTNANSNGGFPVANASGLPGGGFGDGRGFGLASTVSGTVVSVGTDSITVKLASGQTVTLATTSSTAYHAQTAGSSSDLTSGDTVLVQTTGGDAIPGASASSATQSSRTATDVTITTTK